MLCPSGWVRKAGSAFILNVAGVPFVLPIPGAAACTAVASRAPTVAAPRGSSLLTAAALLMIVANIVFPSVLRYDNFGHLAAEVLRIVRQVIQVRRVQVIGAGGHRVRAR